MAEVTFTTKYKAGHSYKHTWRSTELHCLGCGVKAVWRDTSGGDYYVGEQHVCVACEAVFHLPDFRIGALDYVDQQTFDAIRAAQRTSAP